MKHIYIYSVYIYIMIHMIYDWYDIKLVWAMADVKFFLWPVLVGRTYFLRDTRVSFRYISVLEVLRKLLQILPSTGTFDHWPDQLMSRYIYVLWVQPLYFCHHQTLPTQSFFGRMSWLTRDFTLKGNVLKLIFQTNWAFRVVNELT